MEENKKLKDIEAKLAAPFMILGADKKMYPNHKWKPNTWIKGGVICVPYIDARQVIERLNDVLGIDGWSNNLIEMSGKGLICELNLMIDGKEISKSNVGTESSFAKEKGQASDAIKRAAVNFGIGLYLYEMQPVTLKTSGSGKDKHPITEKGVVLKTGEDLSSYINMMNPLRQKLSEIYRSISKENKPKIEKEIKKIWELLNN